MPTDRNSRSGGLREGRETPVILCALEFEKRALARARLDARARIEVCGPGAEGIVRWSEREGPRAHTVILAGLAGALRESCAPGAAYAATTIIAESGRQYRSAFTAELIASEARGLKGHGRIRSAIVASADHVVATAAEKRSLAEKYSAELVDMESAMFAEAATIFGWRWAIVKGVSDSHGDNLPRDVAKWADRDGRSRPLRVLASLAIRPWTLPGVLRLRRNSATAMEQVASLVGQFLDAMTDEVAVTARASGPGAQTILIFGGTFDPPHRAHVEIPQRIAESLGCDQILFVPARANPLKDQAPIPVEHRLEMLRLALRNCQTCSVSPVELERPGPSYTIDTLKRLRADYPAGTTLRLLLGADAALEFHRWKDSRQILELATPVVILRPPLTRDEFAGQMRRHWAKQDVERWMSWIVDAPYLDISARKLRDEIRQGTIDSSMIDASVLAYIREHDLYTLPIAP